MKLSIWVIGIGAFFSVLQAEVIYKDDNPGSAFTSLEKDCLVDNIASEVGDIITVVIDEKAIANFNANTSMSKKDQSLIKTLLNFSFIDSWFSPAKTETNSSNQGSGTTVQTNTMKTSVTAVIKEKLPRDRYIIEANKEIIVNNETQNYVLSGVISKFDIRSDNTIRSDKVAESSIKLDAEGQIAERQRKGIMTKILDWLF